jgi:protocatechuate 3,4-dioxygenase, beta subunit
MAGHLSRGEAFRFYGARPKNANWSVCAENAKGELVVSLWGHHMLPPDGDTIRFADKVSRWTGPGNREFRQRLGEAFVAGQVVRAVIARTDGEHALQDGKDAGTLKNSFIVRPEWFGRVTHWDGDTYEIAFVERKPGLHGTSEQTIGPFYPVTEPLDQAGDLTVVRGRAGVAQGQIVYLSGRVLDQRGEPIPNATVEVWQANTFGRYTHPGDSNPVPLDPSFEGHGVCVTNTDGTFSFKTVKPGAYPGAGGRMRPPHIHFLVASGPARLVTQMYFQGEPLNETDELLGSAEDPESLIARVTPASTEAEPGALVLTWDIVLPRTGSGGDGSGAERSAVISVLE